MSVDRKCMTCASTIPAARLKAIPTATQCVPCLESAGDVVRTRRYDELGPDGEVFSSYFTHNPYFEEQISRQQFALRNPTFRPVLTDDSDLELPDHSVIGALPLSAVIEEEEQEIEQEEQTAA